MIRMPCPARIALAAVTLLTFVACIPEKRITWSPDGAQALLIGGDHGLYLCSPTGTLSDALSDNVQHVEWFRDGQHIAIVRQSELADWQAITQHVDAATVERLRKLGDQLVAEAQQNTGSWDDFGKTSVLGTLSGDFDAALLLYARDERAADIKPLLGDKWKDLAGAKASWWTLEVTTVVDNTLTGTTTRVATLGEISDVRPAPNGARVAFVATLNGEREPSLYAVQTAGDTVPVRVAERVSFWPDWTADSAALVCATANIPAPPGVEDSQSRLGTIMRHAVTEDANGQLQAGDHAELAGIIFAPETRVRCLSDGRILVATYAVELPACAGDIPRKTSLYELWPAQHNYVADLIQANARVDQDTPFFWFEVSPDEQRVLFPDENDGVRLLTLRTGDVQSVPFEGKLGDAFLPVWRTATEVCLPVQAEGADRSEAVLCTVPTQRQAVLNPQRAISTAWPEAVVKDLPVEPKQESDPGKK